MLRRFLKCFFAFFFLVLIVSIGLSILVFSSAKAMQTVLLFGSNYFLGDKTVRFLKIETQDIRWPLQIVFENVSLSIVPEGDPFDIYIERIQFSQIWNIFFSGESIAVQLTGVDIKSKDLLMDQIDVYLLSHGISEWEGLVFFKEIKSQGLKITDGQTHVAFNLQKIVFSDFLASAYSGSLNAQADISLIPRVFYEAEVRFESLDAEKMEDLNSLVFSQMRGLIYGNGKIRGRDDSVRDVELRVYLKDGGKIQAKAFEPIISYLPKSIEKKEIQQAIFDNRLIDVSDAQIFLENKDVDVVSTYIKLKSSQLNLDVNLTIDILVEGGLHHLLKYIIPISQFLKGE